MHNIFNTVKNSFAAIVEARPVSHAAALTLLGTSLYGVHEGADAVLPAGLTAALTFAMVGGEWLQWTSLGRLRAIDDAGDDARSLALKAQCLAVGCLQVLLYSLFVWNVAREAGANWGQGWPLLGVVSIATVFAGLNFVAKWTSCDAIETYRRAGPTGGRRSPAPVHAETARFTSDQGVIDFEARLRAAGERELADQRAKALLCDADRLNNARRAQKRIRTRNRRAVAAQEAARATG
jgi:hypothetical protein